MFDRTGDRLRGMGADGLRVMRDPDLLESGLLCPGSCAAAEAAVLAATGGPGGVVASSFGWEADAVAVRTAIECLEAADDAVRLAIEGLDRQLVLTMGPLAAAAIAADPDLLTELPGLTEHLVERARRARLGRPPHDAVRRPRPARRDDPTPPCWAPPQPASVRDLIEHLHEVADLSGRPDSPANGTIEVQTITGPDGAVRHVLYLPGTDDFNAPWDQDADVRDLETDLDSVAGRPDAYQQGILEALDQAGVGHGPSRCSSSATPWAGWRRPRSWPDHGGYHVTDVVTAGSPTAQVPGFPTGSHVLSLEQQGDIVPELDGAPNPDSVEQTTVTFDAHPDGGITAHHSYDVYEEGAGLVDAATDPSVIDVVRLAARPRLPRRGRPGHQPGLPDHPSAVSASSSAAVSSRSPAARFSTRCASLLVPGMTSTCGPRLSVQASRTWAGVAPCACATALTTSCAATPPTSRPSPVSAKYGTNAIP